MKWSVSRKGILDVDEMFPDRINLTAKKAGKTVIFGKFCGKTMKCVVMVTKPNDSIKIGEKTYKYEDVVKNPYGQSVADKTTEFDKYLDKNGNFISKYVGKQERMDDGYRITIASKGYIKVGRGTPLEKNGAFPYTYRAFDTLSLHWNIFCAAPSAKEFTFSSDKPDVMSVMPDPARWNQVRLTWNQKASKKEIVTVTISYRGVVFKVPVKYMAD